MIGGTLVVEACALVACGSSSSSPTAADANSQSDASSPSADGSSFSSDAASARDAAVEDANADAGTCTTLVTYGESWIHAASHPTFFDDANALVTWDGTCVDDGANSYAILSNGWKPYFQGNGACVVALDPSAACSPSPAKCTTRVTYGSAWMRPTGHTAQYDDIAGRVFGSGTCTASSSSSYEDLSNGFQPHFTGTNSCELSFEYSGCGGLYQNPVIPTDCPDPGVLYDGSKYVLSCTSGDAADAFPIYTSPDLVNWTRHGNIFPSASKPKWATGDFWAPEIHKVGSQFIAYFSAQNSDGKLSIGAASASSSLGPFTDIGAPLIHDPNMGLIDASEFNDTDGSHYVLWKEDGNAVGKPTPIHAQLLSANGLTLSGTAQTLITNDQAWEGNVTEGPFMVMHSGTYYLFYSGNNYGTASYAVGVARASSPIGAFTKQSGPIVTSNSSWGGPGHCSVIDTPAGDTYMVFHAWEAAHIGASPGRLTLTDEVVWQNDWPAVPFAPSSKTRPLP